MQQKAGEKTRSIAAPNNAEQERRLGGVGSLPGGAGVFLFWAGSKQTPKRQCGVLAVALALYSVFSSGLAVVSPSVRADPAGQCPTPRPLTERLLQAKR